MCLYQTPGRRPPPITDRFVNTVTRGWVGAPNERAPFRFHGTTAKSTKTILYERVWCTTQLAKLSFNHSHGRTHSWRFSTFYKTFYKLFIKNIFLSSGIFLVRLTYPFLSPTSKYFVLEVYISGMGVRVEWFVSIITSSKCNGEKKVNELGALSLRTN